MLKKAASVLVPAALMLGAWSACVGDDPSASDAEGGAGQRCFENQTCLGTLRCERGLCVAADADGGASSGGTSGGTGGTSGSSGTSGTSGTTTVEDAGSDGQSTCTLAAQNAGPPCESSSRPFCMSGDSCCSDGGAAGNHCATVCDTGFVAWACERNAHCAVDNDVCCIEGSDGAGDETCSAPGVEAALSRCRAKDECQGVGRHRACNKDSDCPAPSTCVARLIETKLGMKRVLEICD